MSAPSSDTKSIGQSNQARQEFLDDDVHKADFYEAALTVALWHHDEVLAVMAEHGYGIRQ